MTRELGVLRCLEQLAELGTEWDRLYDEATPRNPFLSAGWTLACLETTARGTKPFVVTLREQGRLIAVAPLAIERRSGFRVLRFIAEGRADYLGFLCSCDRRDAEEDLLNALVNWSGEWDLIVLKQLRSDHWDVDRVRIPTAFEWRSVRAATAPYTAADVDWHALHDAGPTWLKRTRKRLPRFLRDGWHLERFTGADAAARLDEVATIEAHSWKAAEKVMRLQHGDGQELFRRAFSTVAEMQLWLAFLDGRAAAYEIDFALPEQLWIYQLGYDQQFQRASVGSFLSYVAIEHAWRAGAREYDYMSGDESYKEERTTASRVIWHLAFYRRTLGGRSAYLLLVAPRWRLRNVGIARAAYRLSTAIKQRFGKAN